MAVSIQLQIEYLDRKRYNPLKGVGVIEEHPDDQNTFPNERILQHVQHERWKFGLDVNDAGEYAIHSTAIKEKQIQEIEKLLFSWFEGNIAVSREIRLCHRL